MADGFGVRNDLVGAVTGAVVQAGSIQQVWLAGGSVPAERPLVPRQLPASVRDFTGRAEYLAALDQLLPDQADTCSGSVVISAVDGTAGVGKTELAVHWAHRVEHHFPDGILFTNLHGYGPGEPVAPSEVLDGYLRVLGTPIERIPSGLEARAGLYRSLLAGKRMLIVLDNADTAEQVRPLLPGSGGCLVVVTSRASLSGLVSGEGAHRVTLDRLPLSEAVDLVHRIVGPAGVAAESDEVIRLARLCDRLPLALRIATSRMVARPHLTVADVVTEMADDEQRLDALSTAGDERTDVRAVFAWSYRGLPAEEARVFRSLGLHPGPEISTAAAAALAGLTIARARSLLKGLAEVHLIEPVTPDRYRLHDLLWVFAAECAARDEDADAVVQVQARLFGWYTHTAARACALVFPGILRLPLELESPPCRLLELTGHVQALNWLDVERANLIAAVRCAVELGFPQLAMYLVDAIHVFLISRAHRDDLVTVHTIAIAAAQRSGNRTCEGWFHFYRGWAYSQLSQWDDAHDPLQQARAVAQELPNDEMHAWALTALGRISVERQRYAEALDYLNPALRLSKGLDSRRMESVVQQYLGLTHRRLGDNQLARAHAERAVALRSQAGDREGDTYALHELALVLQNSEDHQNAIALCTEAIDIARTCTVFPPQTANTLVTLATSL